MAVFHDAGRHYRDLIMAPTINAIVKMDAIGILLYTALWLTMMQEQQPTLVLFDPSTEA